MRGPDSLVAAARIEVAAATLEGAARRLGGMAARMRELEAMEAGGGSLLAWAEVVGRLAALTETLGGYTALAYALAEQRLNAAAAEVAQLRAIPRP